VYGHKPGTQGVEPIERRLIIRIAASCSYRIVRAAARCDARAVPRFPQIELSELDENVFRKVVARLLRSMK